jgi:hypothetical protein
MAEKDLSSGLVGAEGIVTVRLGKLCGDLTQTAQMGVFIGIQESQTVSGTAYAQVGCTLYRDPLGNEDTIFYFECTPVDGVRPKLTIEDSINTPVDGFQYQLRFMVDPSSGDAYYKLSGIDGAVSVPSWVNRTMRYVNWAGEIDGRESDMPGTSGAPCDFYSCRYFLNNVDTSLPAAFNNNDCIECNPQVIGQEWGIDSQNDWVWIWDLDTL